jgi:16S rRNA (guanine527-N7)-methyltransferase
VNANDFRQLLRQTLFQHGFPLTDLQVEQFTMYWTELKRWNLRMNLTAIRDDREIIVKHFLDSLSALHYFSIQPGDSVIDIGTGAGFPGIPIKIYIPDVRLALVESSLKKVSFLRFLVSQLRESEAPAERRSKFWTNVCVIAQRAEECAAQNQHQKAYDWVLTRYVASLEDSMAYCLPLLKPNGTWIAYKLGNVQLRSELGEATPKLQLLGGKVQSIIHSHIAKLNRTYVAIRINDVC